MATYRSKRASFNKKISEVDHFFGDQNSSVLSSPDIANKRTIEKVLGHGYMREINKPWLAEIIMERFGTTPFNLMGERCLIYGGAVRDALAGLPLLGDLDIATPQEAFSSVFSNFNKSVQWTKTNCSRKKQERSNEFRTPPLPGERAEEVVEKAPMPVDPAGAPVTFAPARVTRSTSATTNRAESTRESAPIMTEKYRRFRAFVERYHQSQTSESGGYGNNRRILGTACFVGVGGAVVELIKMKNLDDLPGAIAREVDMVCCGLTMDNKGRVFEVVEGAEEDCERKVLRVSESAVMDSEKNLMARVDRLEERGWKSLIDLKSIRKKVAKRSVKTEKNARVQVKNPRSKRKESLSSLLEEKFSHNKADFRAARARAVAAEVKARMQEETHARLSVGNPLLRRTETMYLADEEEETR